LTFAPAGEPAARAGEAGAGRGGGGAQAPALPAEMPGRAEAACRFRPRQVFGLVDMAGEVSAAYCPSLPGRVAPSAGDGVRFHIPLRGSAGFAPASL